MTKPLSDAKLAGLKSKYRAATTFSSRIDASVEYDVLTLIDEIMRLRQRVAELEQPALTIPPKSVQ